MGTISLDGLASGLNSTAIIEGLMNVAQATVNTLSSQKQNLGVKKAKWQTFNGYLDDLKSQIEEMNTAAAFKVMQASSSSSTKLTAAVDGEATPGTYAVSVSQLASAQLSISSNEFASGDEQFTEDATPAISITIGTETTEISIDTNTLDGAIASINAANVGVQAYKIEQANGLYVLALAAEDTGEDSAFTITPPTDVAFVEQTEALDTLAKVNGIDVRSSTTDITGAIPGLTLTALDEIAEGSEVDISVTKDTDAIKSNIESFVGAYNMAMNFISGQLKVDESTGKAGVLSGDSTLNSIQRTLQTLIRSNYTTNTNIDSLSKLGITTSSDGTLSIDSEDLTDALNDHFAEVSSFFTSTSGLFDAFTNSTNEGRLDFILDSVDGTVQTRLDSLDDMIEDLDARIVKENARLARVEEGLQARFASLEVTMSQLQLTAGFVTNLLG